MQVIRIYVLFVVRTIFNIMYMIKLLMELN